MSFLCVQRGKDCWTYQHHSDLIFPHTDSVTLGLCLCECSVGVQCDLHCPEETCLSLSPSPVPSPVGNQPHPRFQRPPWHCFFMLLSVLLYPYLLLGFLCQFRGKAKHFLWFSPKHPFKPLRLRCAL